MAKNQYEMQDPVTQYPNLEIPEQRQSEPGLDAEMVPKADHGEETYVGSERLKGRKALITGGDSGIGRAVAIAFAREGADVAITYLPSEKTDADYTLELIERAGRKAVGIEADFMDKEAPGRVVNEVINQLGSLDILVNNAGKQVYSTDFMELNMQQVEDTFRVNILSMFDLTQRALKHMPKGSSIINTTSIVAKQPSVNLIDYSSTKAAIVAFTKALAEQMAPKGIRVNAVAPGPIWTPLQPSYGQPMEKLTAFGQDAPIGRAGQPAELAPAYVYLASQESSYTIGEVIAVAGGRT